MHDGASSNQLRAFLLLSVRTMHHSIDAHERPRNEKWVFALRARLWGWKGVSSVDERLQPFIEQIQGKLKACVLRNQQERRQKAPPWLTGRWRSWSTPCCWAEE